MSKSHPSGNDCTDVSTDADLSSVVEDLTEVIQAQQETIDRLEDRVSELEGQQDDHQEQTARQRAEDRQRLTEVEDRIEDLEAGPDPQGPDGEDRPTHGHERPETPLEQTAALPPEMIDGETANVQRAVFVARDVTDYTRKVPAGYQIKSSELRKVLRAGTDAKGHTQTVGRVMEVLDDLGKDDVEVVERRGQRRVVFSAEIVDRLDAIGQGPQQNGHGVVAGGKV